MEIVADDIFYFDADMVCLKAWNPQTLLSSEGRLGVVRDEETAVVEMECKAIGIPFGHYFNSGLFLAPRSLRPQFQRLRRHPAWNKPRRWHEQSVFNAFFHPQGVRYLPGAYNRLIRIAYGKMGLGEIARLVMPRRADTINLHFTRVAEPLATLRRLIQML